MDAGIIVIGNEILSGETVDTNSQFLGKVLNNIGFNVKKKITIPDDKNCIIKSLDEIFEVVDVVLMSGGLGPTNDDITKNTLVEYYNTELEFRPEVRDNVYDLLKHRYKNLSKLHETQAMIPKNATTFRNRLGTASGLLFEENSKVLIAMPGVPFELKGLTTNEVIPWLQKRFTGFHVVNRNIKTIGLGESVIASKIADIEASLPSEISMAYLPNLAQVKIRLTAKGENLNFLTQKLEAIQLLIAERLENYIYGYGEVTIEEAIGKLLLNSKATLATAESCTGGYISHLITSIPGSSRYFIGGINAYSNKVKIGQLKVDSSIIAKHGAVSKESAESMAIGARNEMGSDYAISTTGIAGPDGGTEEKPVGTIWFAVADKDGVVSDKLIFDRGRMQNIKLSAVVALNLLRKRINLSGSLAPDRLKK